jgi:hypothetical protein
MPSKQDRYTVSDELSAAELSIIGRECTANVGKAAQTLAAILHNRHSI